MNSLCKSFIVALAIVHVSQAQSYLSGPPNSQNLANLFFRSRMASRDPAVTMACFGDYMVTTNDVGEAYSAEYNQCLVDAKDGRKAIEAEMAGKRTFIAKSSKDVCESMETCNGLNSTLAIFSCHAEIGANNTKLVYGISGNASEYAGIMHEKYRLIDLRHEQCCKTAERKYVEETARVYRTLQDCLEGRIAPTTARPSTTTAAAPVTPTTTRPVPTTNATTTTTTTTTTTPRPSPTSEVPVEPSTTAAAIAEIPIPTPTGSNNFAAQLLKLFK